MKLIICTLCIFSLCFCKHKNIENKDIETKNIELKKCRIVEFYDKDNVFRLDFVCDNDSVISSFDLYQNSPYINIDFPIITESTDFYKVDPYHKYSIKKGFIDYNLTGVDFDLLNKSIPHSLNNELKNYKIDLAITRCYAEVFEANRAVVNYYISLSGYKDSFSNRGTLFLGGHLFVFNEMGEIVYVIFANDYAITNPKIEIKNNLLYFRTVKILNEESFNGFEIHDLSIDSTLYDFGFKSSFSVKTPIQINSYLIFQVMEDFDYLKYLFVFDVNSRTILENSFDKKYPFLFFSIDNENVIMRTDYTPDETMTYDTLRLMEFKKITETTAFIDKDNFKNNVR